MLEFSLVSWAFIVMHNWGIIYLLVLANFLSGMQLGTDYIGMEFIEYISEYVRSLRPSTVCARLFQLSPYVTFSLDESSKTTIVLRRVLKSINNL